MADLNDLTDELNRLANEIKNGNTSKEETEPTIEIPQKQWYQFGDWFTRSDELLEKILIAITALKQPVTIIEQPSPTPPPQIGIPIPSPVPIGMLEKLDSLIGYSIDAKVALEGLSFKTGQVVMPAVGTPKELIHQLETYFIIIRAHFTNVGNIYIGDKGVSATSGYILAPAEAVSISIDALKKAIYMDADVVGDGVSWLALMR